MVDIAKTFIVFGIILIIFGFILYGMGKIPGMGKLPGDIVIKKENFTFYFPLASSIIISIVLSLIIYLWKK